MYWYNLQIQQRVYELISILIIKSPFCAKNSFFSKALFFWCHVIVYKKLLKDKFHKQSFASVASLAMWFSSLYLSKILLC
jgi:hypothetical protein